MRGKILVAMSGGVDSSAAAALLMSSGCRVEGGTLRLLDSFDHSDAARVCSALAVPHHVIDGRRAFAREVTERFVDAYRAGLTPNPCVLCNRAIKFGLLLDWALENGFEYVATGHYARTQYDPAQGCTRLLRAAHHEKDQSYALYALSQRQLSHALFPLGEMTKDEVRAAAAQANLPVAGKPDSQDICFVPDGDYLAYIRQRAPLTPGEIVTLDGTAVGAHGGIEGYTIGQRKGLGGLGRPMYVTRKNPVTATVTVGPDEALYSASCAVEGINWITSAPRGPFRALIKTRYSHAGANGTVTADGTSATVSFDRPQRALTPGQSAVFYAGDEVLGGGVIEL